MTEYDEIRELALLYSLGALEPEQARAFEGRLAAGDAAGAAELRTFQETAAQLAFALPLAAPAPRVKKKLMARIRPSPPPEGIRVLRAAEQQWRSTPFPGVDFKLLYVDPVTSMATNLLRMQPGAKYPAHRHTQVEQCLVLEGDLIIGDLVLQAGDYELADPSTTHDVVETSQGCLLLIIASQRDELLLA